MEKIEEAQAFEPDRTIRELIGKDTRLEDIFTPEKIAACQKTLDDARDVFFDRARVDVGQLDALARLNASKPDACEATFEHMAICAGNLKGQAEMFGFRLVAAVAGYIVDCCEPKMRTPETRIRLSADLVRLLSLSLREKMTDENGELGRALHRSFGNH